MTSITPRLGVHLLAADEVEAGAALFARAFDDDAFARLITPGARQRRRHLERGGREQIERALPYRHVFGVREGGALRGIAVWLPPGVAVTASGTPPLSALPRLADAALRAGPNAVHYLRARRRAVALVHAIPSWHLAFLATDPDHQRRGIGRLLLAHTLERADVDGAPVWLETSEPANVQLYERFGFVTVALVEGGPTLPTFWFMQRRPGARR
jgi:GNAT superfamily N-acetyltransferase